MKTYILNFVRRIIRFARPRDSYYLAQRSKDPISDKFGYDRGEPIDRYWINKFLEKNKKYIHGVCLEITDPACTKKHGEGRVSRADVLDINTNNSQANIHGDLRNLKGVVKDNTYDCLILTHVLGLIDDCEAAVAECYRILKPGGVLLYTGSCLGPLLERVHWRFTPYSVEYLLKKKFAPKNIVVEAFGSALAGQSFFVGMSQSDLTEEELSYNDPKFPVVVTAVAKK